MQNLPTPVSYSIQTTPISYILQTTPLSTSQCIVKEFTSPEFITTNWGKYKLINDNDVDSDSDTDTEPSNQDIMNEIMLLKKQIDSMMLLEK